MRWLLLILQICFSSTQLISDSCSSGDCLNGKGVKIFDSGDKYDGNFKNGQLEGYGILTSVQKDKNDVITGSRIYQGEWKNNKKTGKGKLIIQKADKYKIYSGMFINGKLNGEGFIETNTEKFIGKFKNNRLYGYGTFENKNGEKYNGFFYDHKFDGRGTYTFKDKTLYIGNFKEGKLHGQGRLFNSNHKVLKSGVWEKGAYKK